jgi:hypothetical protein
MEKENTNNSNSQITILVIALFVVSIIAAFAVGFIINDYVITDTDSDTNDDSIPSIEFENPGISQSFNLPPLFSSSLQPDLELDEDVENVYRNTLGDYSIQVVDGFDIYDADRYEGGRLIGPDPDDQNIVIVAEDNQENGYFDIKITTGNEFESREEFNEFILTCQTDTLCRVDQVNGNETEIETNTQKECLTIKTDAAIGDLTSVIAHYGNFPCDVDSNLREPRTFAYYFNPSKEGAPNSLYIEVRSSYQGGKGRQIQQMLNSIELL